MSIHAEGTEEENGSYMTHHSTVPFPFHHYSYFHSGSLKNPNLFPSKWSDTITDVENLLDECELWDEIWSVWSCGGNQGYLLTPACLSFSFLLWESLFSHRNVFRRHRKNTGKWVNVQLLFNVAILYFIMSWIYILQLPETCILSCLLLLSSIFNLWFTYFETIIRESVSKWCMWLCAHMSLCTLCAQPCGEMAKIIDIQRSVVILYNRMERRGCPSKSYADDC